MIRSTTTIVDPLAEPGVYDGQSMPWVHPDQYHASDRVSRSRLWSILKSPAAYRAYRSEETTRAMLRGDAIHVAVLEPERFDEEYVFPPLGLNRTRKADREQWEEFLATHSGAKIVGWDEAEGRLYQDDAETVRAVAGAVARNPLVERILQGQGSTEPTYAWDADGLRFRVRPDRSIVTAAGRRILVDLKSSADCAPAAFAATVPRYGYHFQAAMYLDGARRATGDDYQSFLFVVFETSYPYHVRPYELDPEAMNRGRDLYHQARAKLVQCTRDDHWPDYSDAVTTLRLPAWAFNDHYDSI